MVNRFWQGVLMGVVLGIVMSLRYLQRGTSAETETVPRRVMARLAVPSLRRG